MTYTDYIGLDFPPGASRITSCDIGIDPESLWLKLPAFSVNLWRIPHRLGEKDHITKPDNIALAWLGTGIDRLSSQKPTHNAIESL